jgi:PhnB protein
LNIAQALSMLTISVSMERHEMPPTASGYVSSFWQSSGLACIYSTAAMLRREGMHVTPYLFLDGRCEEALDFYKKTLDAKVEMMMRFKESPEPAQPGMCPPGSDNKIMHACMRIGDTAVMASDGRCTGQPEFKGFALSVDAKDETDADRKFNALSQGGQVHMPLGETFFAKRFGMVADRFGVGWMIIAGPKH